MKIVALKRILALVCTCVLVVILLSSCGPSPFTPSSVVKPGDYNESLISGNRTRNYILHVPPAYDGMHATPLVLVLHGAGGNAAKMVTATGMSEKADEAGFIGVYPNGTGGISDTALLTWNCGFCCGYALDNNVDDVGFIRSLIEKLEGELSIDTARIFITGMSNGAMMTYRLACELTDIVAAIAPVSGSMGEWEIASSSPVSVIIFHGTADPVVLYNGGAPEVSPLTPGRVDKPVSYAVNFWVVHNGCSTAYTRVTNGILVKDTYSGGRDGTEVILNTITGGGHVWPGDDILTRNISATDLIWQFFAAHPKQAVINAISA